MTTSVPAFRQTQRVLDDAFAPSHSTASHLYLTFGAHRVRVGVVDAQRNKFVALEDYEAEKPTTVQGAISALEQICLTSPLLQQRQWQQIRVSIKNQQFTLIPEALFEAHACEEYLRLNAVIEPDQEEVLYHQHSRLELVNVFTIPARLKAILQNHFPQSPVEFMHQTSALMEGFLHMSERKASPQLCIYVDNNYVTLVVLQNLRLEFCNSFYFTSSEDFIYYVLFVLQEKKMNPDHDQVLVYGELLLNSELHEVMRKYIKHVSFGQKPTGVGYSYRFDALFNHRNFDLYSLHFAD